MENICEIDVSAIDDVKRDSKKVKQFIKSYARNISTLASNKTIIKDIRIKFPNFNENTYYAYLNALKRLFVIII